MGTNQLPKPPIKVGITIKKIIKKAWAVIRKKINIEKQALGVTTQGVSAPLTTLGVALYGVALYRA
jgi:hypothetical protein|tara:strand:- start:778 stop:975 length:198 start_codon:yes stop_codon:yes gene_type:complete